MHNHHSFLQPCTNSFCPHQSQPTCSTAMDPSHQLIAHAAYYSIPPLIPQPTIVEPQMPPLPSTLYMNEFPRQQISQTNFRQSANTGQQCFGTPTVSNNQTVFTTRPQQIANMPTDNSSATQIETTNAAVTHSHPQVRSPQTSTADANYPPVCFKLPPIQIPEFNGDPLAFHDWINIFKAMVHTNHSITQTHRISYLQNSVTGRAKDLIRGYSCNPAFYDVALAELHSHFDSPQHVVSAYIKRLEAWSRITTQNPHTLLSFATFLKQMVQTFTDFHYTADLPQFYLPQFYL